jgi:hypothetical protein
VRLDSYAKVGGFREDLFRSQDFELITRLAQLGQPLFVPKTIFYQRVHTGARGPGSQRFPVEQAMNKWVQFGGLVMRDLRSSVPESRFNPSFAKTCPEAAQNRAALLQRGLIFAQRALWPEAHRGYRTGQRTGRRGELVGPRTQAERDRDPQRTGIAGAFRRPGTGQTPEAALCSGRLRRLSLR